MYNMRSLTKREESLKRGLNRISRDEEYEWNKNAIENINSRMDQANWRRDLCSRK